MAIFRGNEKRQSTGNSKPAVVVEGLTVAYRSYVEHPTSLKESLVRFLRTGKVRYYSTFDALSNVSFSVQKGCILGVIGSNGAGKSTLLRSLVGVLPPTRGSVSIDGSVDSLIQLGAGFDPELNAVENIFLYGSLHGKSKKYLLTRVDSILDFAELKDFKLTPLKYYSSGMSARLGFACAIDIDPDVLLVDEVLAVGDERFAEKCQTVFERFLQAGKTIIIVTHNLTMIEEMADSVLLLSKGRVAYFGDPVGAIAAYRDPKYQTVLK